MLSWLNKKIDPDELGNQLGKTASGTILYYTRDLLHESIGLMYSKSSLEVQLKFVYELRLQILCSWRDRIACIKSKSHESIYQIDTALFSSVFRHGVLSASEIQLLNSLDNQNAKYLVTNSNPTNASETFEARYNDHLYLLQEIQRGILPSSSLFLQKTTEICDRSGLKCQIQISLWTSSLLADIHKSTQSELIRLSGRVR